jgi:DNA-binding HxlR family transcriptional regulator
MRRYSQDCPVARTLDIVGDRWTLLIVRDLFMGASRFTDFEERSPGIPPKVLSARIKMLMEERLVERYVYSQYPLRAGYRLTERGKSLLPVILAIGEWGLEHLFPEEPERRREVAAYIHASIPEARPVLEEKGFV